MGLASLAADVVMAAADRAGAAALRTLCSGAAARSTTPTPARRPRRPIGRPLHPNLPMHQA